MNKSLKAIALMSAGSFIFSMNSMADGRLEGRISDATSSVYFDGAIVKIKELKLESSSKNGGRFSFNNLPAGDYTLVVDYLGAETVQQLISISDNKTTSEAVRIGDDVGEMDNVIVIGQAAGAANALNKQRAADNFKSIVSADSIGQFPDENVSEALQRVPGVFIERDQGEGRFVGVRGVNPNLNSASINGVNIPAPERDRRSVALDVIPSGLLESLEVTKTITPDMDGDTIGANIEIKSLSAFDRDGMSYKLQAEGNYNDLEEETSPKLAGSFTNVFDVAGGELGVAAAVSWQDRDFGSEVIEGDGEWESDIEDSGVRGVKELQQRDYTVNRKRLGVALNLDWRPNELSEYYMRSLYSHFEDQEFRQRIKYKFDKGDLLNIDSNSALWDEGDMERDFKDRFEEQKITSVVFGGSNIVDDWTLEYNLSYSKASENEPDRRDTGFKQKNISEMGYSSLGSSPRIFASDEAFDASEFELDEVVIENNYTEDVQQGFKLDITRDMYFGENPGYIKFGLKRSEREKTDDVNADIYNDFGDIDDPTMDAFINGNLNYAIGNFGPALNKSAIDALINGQIKGNTALQDEEALAESLVSSARDYNVNEDVTAAYIMSRVDINDWRLVYGVRYEHTDFSAEGYNARLLDGEEAEIVKANYERDYSHFLPSVNVRYRFSDEMIVRAAFSQSISRPSFGDITPSPDKIEIDQEDNELQVEAGNPLLKAYESNNFDLSMEYYPDNGIGAFGAALFYKQIDNFIFNADVSSDANAALYAPGVNFDDIEITQPQNGDEADLYGLELTYTKHFANGLLLQANATFTDSEATLDLGEDPDRNTDIQLPEQADRVGNLVLGYEKGPLSLRVSAAYKSERLMELNYEDAANDLYQDEHMQIDLSAKYEVNENLQFHFNAININDEPFYRYHGSRSFNAQYEEYGPSYVLGVTYRNF
ncbi:MAG: TonB-dependent receptor [Cellvibrionaceae bacterium]|nr:TonB-dependent receptor [Cellvibrionaceae bacterium]